MSVQLCPTGCGRTVARGLIMCGICWFEVPTELKQDVESAWRRFNRTHKDDDWNAYRCSYDAAVESHASSRAASTSTCSTCSRPTAGGRCVNPLCSSRGGGVA